MILLFFIAISVLSHDHVTGDPECRNNAGGSSVAISSAKSNSFSSSSRSSSSSFSSSSATVSDCNDFNRCNDRNATYKRCPNPCPGTCTNPQGVPNCLMRCQDNGCECNPGYVVSDNGKCILLEDCPDYLRCRGDRNATFTDCPNPCPQTCQSPGGSIPCSRLCIKEGCECKEGYYLNDEGFCVKLQDCPDYLLCRGDRNATFTDCPNPCPQTCQSPGGSIPCTKLCIKEGCECKEGYYLNDEGFCVKLQDCPDYLLCRGDRNATFTDCPNPCPQTCQSPGGSIPCTRLCIKEGCECKEGYYLNDEGFCVKLQDCPDYLCCRGDCNATVTQCPNPCPRTCQFPGGSGPCSKMCIKEGCECKEGYYLSEEGICVQLQDCPGARACTVNETFVFCNVNCGNNYCPVDDSRGIIACSPPFPCGSGCSCKRDYLRLGREDDRCILASECPEVPCTRRPNEKWSGCPPPCLNERCSDIGVSSECDIRFYSCQPQCLCEPGFFRNDSDICIPQKNCPPKCGYNEMPVQCKTICPPQSCEISYTDYACGNTTCEPGCDCLPNHLRNASGICIPNEECPPPPVIPTCRLDQNEELSSCKIICPPQSCASLYIRYLCVADIPCEWGCNCINGYLRNSSDVCIPIEQCSTNPPLICGYNEKPSDCKVTCPPQICESIFSRYICKDNDICEPGCDCLDGYLRNASGICIPSEECFLEPECDIPYECRTTCAKPNSQNCPSVDQATENQDGCKCKPGYILSYADGVCIRIEDCPVPKCGYNEMPVQCKTICPPQSCEISYTDYACGNTTCEPGCDCLPNHLRNASGICIPNEECPPPPVIPTCRLDQNEELSSCKIVCPPQSCASLYTLYLCIADIPCEWGCNCIKGYLRNSSNVCVPSEQCSTNPLICGYNEKPSDCKVICPLQTCESIFTTYNCEGNDICEPGCDCLDGYLRNASGICIPSEECFLEPECNIPYECRATCANPNPQNCYSVDQTTENQDGCQCKPGYILSDADGVCISVEECPGDLGCDGDSNSIVTSCPWPCPSTCDSPDASTCGKKCKPVGCQCKPGFILNGENGICILPEQCECGNPCGINGTFSDCAFRCPNQNCPKDDSGLVVACKPSRPCPSGCLCKEYYRRTSDCDDTCVLASDCPVVDCTRPKEEWDPCASECLAEECADLYQKTDCFSDPKNCQPKCVCCEGFYRKNGYCVPKDECEPPCEVKPECRPTCAVPNPLGCPFIPPAETNKDGCNCQQGYILSEYDGKCIKIEECPPNIGCNGDLHARVKECPLPCPSTCDAPNAIPCKRKCDLIGCECEPGYILSNIDGLCIMPDQCIGGNPCGPNATFSACKYNCPDSYCPTDDSRAVVICETFPFAPCFSGCVCNLNHRILSRENPICIRSDECPEIECTRPDEKWSSCPVDCRSEYCEDVENTMVTCYTLVLNCNPRCICKETYFRDPNTDICVTSKECRKINKENQQQPN